VTSRTSAVVAIIVLMIGSCILFSCASPMSRPPTATQSEIQDEARKQRALVLRTNTEMQFKLNNVFSAVLTGASSFCEKKRFIAGYWPIQRDLVSPEYRQALTEVYGVRDLPKIIQVYEGSAAEAAGLMPSDEILSVNGKRVPRAPKDLQAFLSSFSTSPVLEMEVRRGGVATYITIEQSVCCDYPVVLTTDDAVNAWADGKGIYVTRGLMRFMENDAQLATIISHELAHNARGHISMAKKNTAAGGVGGLVLDLFAAAAGVNTGGAFSRMGGDIGRSAYSKDMEREADYVGLYILAASGYDPNEAPDVFRRLGTANPKSIEGKYAVSHPSTPERYVYIEKTLTEISKKQSSGLPMVPEERK
jgi:hypothetical protein